MINNSCPRNEYKKNLSESNRLLTYIHDKCLSHDLKTCRNFDFVMVTLPLLSICWAVYCTIFDSINQSYTLMFKNEKGNEVFANLSPPLPAPISPRPSPPSASEDEPRDKTARISPGSTSSLRCTRLPILSSPSSFFSAPPPPSPPSVLVSFASYSLKSSSSMASIASQSITSSGASPSPSPAASVADGSTAIDCDVSVIDVFVATCVDEDVVVVVVVVVVRFVVCMIVPSTSLFVVVLL
uniref:Uncharacterized protein n=1 Tax=Glossina brevipalpis TaxID=37001 RepID=A0A1A9X1S2_9MUSC